jgi:preprotein translocase SecE subunit
LLGRQTSVRPKSPLVSATGDEGDSTSTESPGNSRATDVSGGDVSEAGDSANSQASAEATEKLLSAEEIQRQMGELRRAKEAKDSNAAKDGDSLMGGVMEEVGLIQWPTFTAALVNTLLVIAIVFGTSLVLFGVNTALTEVSGTIYK